MGLLKKLDKLLVIPLMALLLNISCLPNRDLRNFTLYGETKKVESSKLKIKGAYCTEKKRTYKFSKDDTDNYVECFVLYENGIFLNLFAIGIKSDVGTAINDLVDHFEENKKVNSRQIDMWGAYKIEGEALSIQCYTHPFGVIIRTSKVLNYEMQILNDTTLIEFEDVLKNPIPPSNYYLFKTNKKPDSTNLFMTNKRIKKKLDRLYEKRHRNDNVKKE